MKVSKKNIKEAISNVEAMVDATAVTTPVTAKLKKDMKKKYQDFEKITVSKDNFLGAKKQPLPKKVEVPKSQAKLDLDESLFESSNPTEERDFITAYTQAYDETKKKAKEIYKKQKSDGKQSYIDEIIKGFKGNAKKSFLSDNLHERNLTRAERHNRDMENIFGRYNKLKDDEAKFLISKGVSEDEVKELRKNTGLGRDALEDKMVELGVRDEFFNKRGISEAKKTNRRSPITESKKRKFAKKLKESRKSLKEATYSDQLYDEIYSVIDGMDSSELAYTWNTYCDEANYPDDYLYSMDEIDEILDGQRPYDILRMAFYGNFNPADKYFRFDGYGNLVSYDYLIGVIEIDDMIDHIIERDSDLGSDDIRLTLDQFDEREEVEESLKEGKDSAPSDDLLKEGKQQLNEGPGAGYTITSKIKITNVNSVNINSVKPLDSFNSLDNKEFETYYVNLSCDVDAETTSLSAESYYYDTEDIRESIPTKITKMGVELTVPQGQDVNSIDFVDLLNHQDSEIETELIYGGGWTHSTYDGTLAEKERDLRSSYYEQVGDIEFAIDSIEAYITDEEIINYIDKAVVGDNYTEQYMLYDNYDDVIDEFETEEEAVAKCEETPGSYVEKETRWHDLYGNMVNVDFETICTNDDEPEDEPEDTDIDSTVRSFSKYVDADESLQEANLKEGIFGDYKAYNPEDGWTEEDIQLHKSIDWAARNYEDYDAGKPIHSKVVLYGLDKPKYAHVEMHKFLRSNPIYPPYYKAVENHPFNVDAPYVGPMYDGDKNGKYDIHNRYETQNLYDILSESKTSGKKEKAPASKEEFAKKFPQFFYRDNISKEDKLGFEVSDLEDVTEFKKFAKEHGNKVLVKKFDLFDRVLEEIAPEHVNIKRVTRVPSVEKDDRYDYEEIKVDNNNIILFGKVKSDLKLAEDIAKQYKNDGVTYSYSKSGNWRGTDKAVKLTITVPVKESK